MRIDEIADDAKYRKDEQFQTYQFFENLHNFANLLFLKFDN